MLPELSLNTTRLKRNTSSKVRFNDTLFVLHTNGTDSDAKHSDSPSAFDKNATRAITVLTTTDAPPMAIEIPLNETTTTYTPPIIKAQVRPPVHDRTGVVEILRALYNAVLSQPAQVRLPSPLHLLWLH